jgi:hypothetical protein
MKQDAPMARPNLALPWARQYDFLLRGLHQIGRAIISYENHGMPKVRLIASWVATIATATDRMHRACLTQFLYEVPLTTTHNGMTV